MMSDAQMAERLKGLDEPMRAKGRDVWRQLGAWSAENSALEKVMQQRPQEAARGTATNSAVKMTETMQRQFGAPSRSTLKMAGTMRPQVAIVGAVAAGALVLGATAWIRGRHERAANRNWTQRIEQERSAAQAGQLTR